MCVHRCGVFNGKICFSCLNDVVFLHFQFKSNLSISSGTSDISDAFLSLESKMKSRSYGLL